MTRIQYIDCSKWQKVLGIILWCGATIGLGVAIYGLVTYTYIEENESCYKKSAELINCVSDDGILVIVMWIVSLLANGGNIFGIYYVVNNHYKFIEFRCGKKPVGENQQ